MSGGWIQQKRGRDREGEPAAGPCDTLQTRSGIVDLMVVTSLVQYLLAWLGSCQRRGETPRDNNSRSSGASSAKSEISYRDRKYLIVCAIQDHRIWHDPPPQVPRRVQPSTQSSGRLVPHGCTPKSKPNDPKTRRDWRKSEVPKRESCIPKRKDKQSHHTLARGPMHHIRIIAAARDRLSQGEKSSDVVMPRRARPAMPARMHFDSPNSKSFKGSFSTGQAF